MAEQVRIGVIGCGNVLGAYLATAERLRSRGLASVVAACGRERQRAQVVERLRVPRFTTDAAELIDAVDLVLILTPMDSHAALARQALAAGKHVLVEKPMAVTLDEAAEVLAAARAARGLYLAAPFTPLSPTFRAMAARLRAGEIGRVLSARGRYGWAGPDWRPWFYGEAGGALLDLAVYDVTSFTALLGPVRRVTAMAGIAVPERQVGGERVRVAAEDNAHLVLEHEGGCLTQITAGFTMQQYRSPALELYGTDGTLQMLGDDWDPDGHELWTRAAGVWRVFKESEPDWPWTDGLRALVEAIADGGPPPLPAEHAYHVLEVLLAARASARQGRAIPVTSAFPPIAVGAAAAHEPAHLMHDRNRRVTA